MLIRTTDPFSTAALREWAEHVRGTTSRPAVMPMDAWFDGHEFVAAMDIPGVNSDDIDIDVERSTLTVKVERSIPEVEDREVLVAERQRGVFSRQMVLGENLDMDKLDAEYSSGVLTIRIPVSEQAKPRKVKVRSDSDTETGAIGQE